MNTLCIVHKKNPKLRKEEHEASTIIIQILRVNSTINLYSVVSKHEMMSDLLENFEEEQI